MEPDDLPCSRNARSKTPLIGRAVEDQSAPILEEITSELGGSIVSLDARGAGPSHAALNKEYEQVWNEHA